MSAKMMPTPKMPGMAMSAKMMPAVVSAAMPKAGRSMSAAVLCTASVSAAMTAAGVSPAAACPNLPGRTRQGQYRYCRYYCQLRYRCFEMHWKPTRKPTTVSVKTLQPP